MVARGLGAKVQDKITRDTTHVVAARTGTAKVNDAKKHKNIHLGNVQFSENMNNNEFLPGRYTDLTFEAESGSIHSAPNRESQDFFRGFHL